jgi:hypothetical protein
VTFTVGVRFTIQYPLPDTVECTKMEEEEEEEEEIY